MREVAIIGAGELGGAVAHTLARRDVAMAILGAPPSHVVIPWEDATIGGFAVARVLDTPTRRNLDAKIAALWPPGPFALAAAAVKVIAAIDGRSRQRACCFVAPAP